MPKRPIDSYYGKEEWKDVQEMGIQQEVNDFNERQITMFRVAIHGPWPVQSDEGFARPRRLS